MPYAAFRRQPVPQQYAQNLRTTVFPAPTRGIVQSENEAYMQPGGSTIQDNWVTTMRGIKLRGGFIRWSDLHALDVPGALPWVNNHSYIAGNIAFDVLKGTFWNVVLDHTSPVSGSFEADRTARSANWTANPTVITRLPVISSFEYVSSSNQRMFAANATKLFDVTSPVTTTMPILIKSGQNSGNYVAAHFANAAAGALDINWMVVCNEAGDYPLRTKDGILWITLDGTAVTNWANGFAYTVGVRAKDTVDNTIWLCAVAHTSAAAGTFAADRAVPAHSTWWVPASDGASFITGPAGTHVEFGRNLSYVWKYRSRLYFIEKNSMNAWYLPIDAIGGVLTKIPLAGAITRGGELLFGDVLSLDAGDGLDDKNVMVTTTGEVLIFTGSNPADPANWRQEGRWAVSPPLGMNAHIQVGGDLLVMTIDGIVPLTQAVSKDTSQLELAVLTRNIKPLWRSTVDERRTTPWTFKKWDEYGGLFVAAPGIVNGSKYCFVANNVNGAWGRLLYDATCFLRLRADMFFGTQAGIIMQCERTGLDDGVPYNATLVGGWEMFGQPANTFVWHQARASFHAGDGQLFKPQLSATVNYEIDIPPPPLPGPDPGIQDVWDQGLWDVAKWDQPSVPLPVPIRNTGWISIGQTGFAHAPIVQVTVAQVARPDVELIAIAATFEPAGVNV